MCLLAGAESSRSCVFFVLTLLSYAPLASTEAVVRRESSHPAGRTSISDQVYEHELLHEGTVKELRKAMHKARNPYQVAEKVLKNLAPSLQEIALHEAESFADDEVVSRAPENSMLQSEEREAYASRYNPYIVEEVESYVKQEIKNGDRITLKDWNNMHGYLMGVPEAQCDDHVAESCHMENPFDSDEMLETAGCLRTTPDIHEADEFIVHEMGGSSEAIVAGREISLRSTKLATKLSGNSTNGTYSFYLGICKPEGESESNGHLYFFKRHRDDDLHVLPNAAWTISWEDPVEGARHVKNQMGIRLRSAVGKGYLLSDTEKTDGHFEGGLSGEFKEPKEEPVDLPRQKELADKAIWLIGLGNERGLEIQAQEDRVQAQAKAEEKRKEDEQRAEAERKEKEKREEEARAEAEKKKKEEEDRIARLKAAAQW